MESYHIEVTGTSLEDIYIYASDREIDQLESIRDILTYVYEHDIFDDNLDTFLEFADIRLRERILRGIGRYRTQDTEFDHQAQLHYRS